MKYISEQEYQQRRKIARLSHNLAQWITGMMVGFVIIAVVFL